MSSSWHKISHREIRQAGTWDMGPGILCPSSCNACTRTNISTNKIQRNYKGLKITVYMESWGKLWARRHKNLKTQLQLFKSREQNRVLCISLACTTTKGVGRPPKPPLWPDPWTCPLPSTHIRNQLTLPLPHLCPSKRVSGQGKLLPMFAPPMQ